LDENADGGDYNRGEDEDSDHAMRTTARA